MKKQPHDQTKQTWNAEITANEKKSIRICSSARCDSAVAAAFSESWPLEAELRDEPSTVETMFSLMTDVRDFIGERMKKGEVPGEDGGQSPRHPVFRLVTLRSELT